MSSTLYRINNSDCVKRCQTKILRTNFCLRYHALISVIWMFLGVLILASKTFHLISIEPIACGFLLLCCSIFAVRRLTAHRETTSTCGFLVLPQVSKGDHHCFCSWSRQRFLLPTINLSERGQSARQFWAVGRWGHNSATFPPKNTPLSSRRVWCQLTPLADVLYILE